MNPGSEPDEVVGGLAPGGVLLHVYDGQRGGLVCRRAVEGIAGLDEFGPPDVANVIDEHLRPLRIIAYHGDSGARLPGEYGVVCQLRTRTRAIPPRESGPVEDAAAVDDPEPGR